jgi:membrane fusion protein (multidrug efflux system)
MKTENKKKYAVAFVVAAAIIGGGAWYYSLRFETTDNAYTAAHLATLSPKVAGLVTEVLVEENYKVKKDQVLVRIDNRDYKNALDHLKAELGAAEALLKKATKDLERSQKLFIARAATEQERDDDVTNLRQLEKKYDALKAQVDEAELNLQYTEIRAPADGTVGKKLVEPGMVINIGQPLMSFVDSQPPWIVANFKETQLKKMVPGQKAEIEIDSIGGKTFEGVIESFAPGTGATFALIPPDNATSLRLCNVFPCAFTSLRNPSEDTRTASFRVFLLRSK